MPIVTIANQDIFNTECDILVNTVNCVGIIGKGIALEVKKRHPFVFENYREACRNNKILPGILEYYTVHGYSYKYILNFPTKRHWRDNSRLEDIELGLQSLTQKLNDNNDELFNKSLALPKLGCGNGGLNWWHVKPLIHKYLSELKIIVKIYE